MHRTHEPAFKRAKSLALALLLPLMATSAACSGNEPTFRPDTGGNGGDATTTMDGTTNGDGGTTPDAIVVRETGPVVIDPDASCARQSNSTSRAPANILIVLDRSGSMGESASGSGGRTRWAAAIAGIERVLTLLDDDTRVGLMVFPAPTNGSAPEGYTTPSVPVAPLRDNRREISIRLDSFSPNGGTPMACAMPKAIEYFGTGFSMDGSRNVVLITDGEPTDECSGVTCNPFDIANFIPCIMNASVQAQARIQVAATAGARREPPIRTFVVGTPSANEAFLSNLAVNGGTPRSDDCVMPQSCHYSLRSATFEDDLNAALDAIRGRATTCEYRINADVNTLDPRLVNVNYVERSGATPRLVPMDPANGWTYSDDGRSVIFHGDACAEVMGNSTGGSVQIIFGCPTVTPG